jgi:hypothetical protein
MCAVCAVALTVILGVVIAIVWKVARVKYRRHAAPDSPVRRLRRRRG